MREAQKEYSSNSSDGMRKKESSELVAQEGALFPFAEDYTCLFPIAENGSKGLRCSAFQFFNTHK